MAMAVPTYFSFPRLLRGARILSRSYRRFHRDPTSTTAPPSRHHLPSLPFPTPRQLSVRTQDSGDPLGDFGARDPTSSTLSLAELNFSPVSHLQAPMSREDATPLLRKIVGWRLVEEDGVLKLRCLWKLRNFKCGVELVKRIFDAVESTGRPSIHLEGNFGLWTSNQFRADLWTSSIGGLSMNDFIVAAKIDLIKTSDLVRKERVWAQIGARMASLF